jgi:5,5'-dehydrodivanillate O-demethylase
VLSPEKNLMLTQVGAGTPMGELLRRYWHPIAPAMELRERRVKPIRLLGEDLVLFRKPGGEHGLISRYCPHRRTDLSIGWMDGEVMRCAYHGWAFDSDGRCVEQPFEEAGPAGGFHEKAGVTSYPTATLGGLVWAYLGPTPAPLLPNFENFSWEQGFVELILTELPCNWFQCHENGMDPVHFEWLHSNGNAVRLNPEAPVFAPRHTAIDFLEFEHGFVNGREVETENAPEGAFARTSSTADGGILCLWPYILASGNTVEFRVPMDDHRTLNITWQYSILPDDVTVGVPQSEEVPYWYGPLTEPGTDQLITSHTGNQDFAVWIGQGTVTDRSAERLGRSDKGITLLRRRYLEVLEQVARGEDPPGTVRDPAANVQIPLPLPRKFIYTDGVPRDVFEEKLAARRKSGLFGIGGFLTVQAGRPDHLQAMYEKAAGIADRPALGSGGAG